jgi:hypothetical protein
MSLVTNEIFKKWNGMINWVLENMKNLDNQICNFIESKMNEVIEIINQSDSMIDANKLNNELRILDWIFHELCVNDKQTSFQHYP